MMLHGIMNVICLCSSTELMVLLLLCSTAFKSFALLEGDSEAVCVCVCGKGRKSLQPKQTSTILGLFLQRRGGGNCGPRQTGKDFFHHGGGLFSWVPHSLFAIGCVQFAVISPTFLLESFSSLFPPIVHRPNGLTEAWLKLLFHPFSVHLTMTDGLSFALFIGCSPIHHQHARRWRIVLISQQLGPRPKPDAADAAL